MYSEENQIFFIEYKSHQGPASQSVVESDPELSLGGQRMVSGVTDRSPERQGSVRKDRKGK